MHLEHTIELLGVHAEGEIGRVIVSGAPDIPGATMVEKMNCINTVDDSLFTYVVTRRTAPPALVSNPGRLALRWPEAGPPLHKSGAPRTWLAASCDGCAEADAQAQNLILDAYPDRPATEASLRKGSGRLSRIGLEDLKPGSRNRFRGFEDHPFYRRRQACRRYSSRPVTMTCRTRTTTQA